MKYYLYELRELSPCQLSKEYQQWKKEYDLYRFPKNSDQQAIHNKCLKALNNIERVRQEL